MKNSQQQSQKDKNGNKTKKKGASKYKTAKFVRIPCKDGEECVCQDCARPSRDLAIVSVVETDKKTSLPAQPKDDVTQNVAEEKLLKDTCKQLVLVNQKGKPSSKQKIVGKGKAIPRTASLPRTHPHLSVIKKKGKVEQQRRGSSPLYRAMLSKLNISRWKIYKFGEKGSGYKAKTDTLQDFMSLREECLQKGVLFVDPEFPAVDSSLYFQKMPHKQYEWKRPKDIVEEPHFFVEGFSRFDIVQGDVGDCWILAAAGNLTLYRNLFLQIVPDDQDFFDDQYAGIFRFRVLQT